MRTIAVYLHHNHNTAETVMAAAVHLPNDIRGKMVSLSTNGKQWGTRSFGENANDCHVACVAAEEIDNWKPNAAIERSAEDSLTAYVYEPGQNLDAKHEERFKSWGDAVRWCIERMTEMKPSPQGWESVTA